MNEQKKLFFLSISRDEALLKKKRHVLSIKQVINLNIHIIGKSRSIEVTDISILSTLGFYKLKHIYKHIFTVKNGKKLSMFTVRSFQRYAYKKN